MNYPRIKCQTQSHRKPRAHISGTAGDQSAGQWPENTPGVPVTGYHTPIPNLGLGTEDLGALGAPAPPSGGWREQQKQGCLVTYWNGSASLRGWHHVWREDLRRVDAFTDLLLNEIHS